MYMICYYLKTFRQASPPKKNNKKHYYYGDKWANALLCCLQVGIKKKKEKKHGFAINLLNTDRRGCGEEYHIKHVLLSWFLFHQEGKTMLEKVQTILSNFPK